MTCLADIDVAVLCGGLGTRTGNPDLPKALTPIRGKPFLEHHLAYLAKHGAKRVVLCVGRHAGQVRAHVEMLLPDPPMEIVLSEEAEQRGTAEAMRTALPLLAAPYALVTNGDTLTDLDLCRFVQAIRGADASAGIVLMRPFDVGPVVSAGLRLVKREMLDRLDGPGLDDWLEPRAAHLFFNGSFLDIGTPERLALAEHFLR